MGYIYLKNKKIVELQTQIDSKIDTNRIQDLFAQTFNQRQKGQSQLVNYLINKLVNFESTDHEATERLRFEKGFRQLNLESQEEFFKKANQSHCLGAALQWIPKDIKELHFISGPENAIFNSETSKKTCNSF
ncbi:MAG: hypothetical protein HWD61_08475 [Parachlamydiaceae bacterium]|nr:MAG: hypothetical protein HWD61_08475 [Parachlamydiaceae bacterium]